MKKSRSSLDKAIAAARSPREKRMLAIYGLDWKYRTDSLVDQAITWKRLRETTPEQRSTKYFQEWWDEVVADLCNRTVAALWRNEPETLESLAKAMRQADAGEFDGETADRARLALLCQSKAGTLNVAKEGRSNKLSNILATRLDGA